MAKYRVLSIDGGGIRGLITVILLRRITETPGLENFLDSVDLIAGTSTGGLLALGIAHQLGLDQIRDVYVEKGPKIFDDSLWDDITDLGKLIGADYDIKPLRRELKRLFNQTKLGELSKKVLITAFDLDNGEEVRQTWKPKLFHNFTGERNDKDALVYKVALYTAAAPTYFPSVDGYIDGGVYASNPSMCALTQTQDSRYPPIPAMDEIYLFSLGTGTSLQYIRGQRHDWGYAQWAKKLITLMLEGTAGIADYQCKQILNERYWRLGPEFPKGITIAMDDIKRIPYMIDFAEKLSIDKTTDWLLRTWN